MNNFKIFTQYITRKLNEKKVSSSAEDLMTEITTPEYEQKVKSLIKNDLSQKYSWETIEDVVSKCSFFLVDGSRNPESEDDISQSYDREPDISIPARRENLKEAGIHLNLENERIDEISKIENRIPKWFRNAHQINTRILVAYMELLGDTKSVPYYKLEASCRTIKTFKNNYIQMKSFGEKNHAKVFEEAGSRITLWEPTREFVKKEYQKFLRKS